MVGRSHHVLIPDNSSYIIHNSLVLGGNFSGRSRCTLPETILKAPSDCLEVSCPPSARSIPPDCLYAPVN